MQKLNFINLNKKIYYYLWDDVEQIKGVIQISHGMCEYAERYDNIAKFFNKHGYVLLQMTIGGMGIQTKTIWDMPTETWLMIQLKTCLNF